MSINIQHNTGKVNTEKSFLLLVRKPEQASEYLQEKESSYLLAQAEDKKKQIELNRFGSYVWIVIADEEANNQKAAEKARKQGCKMLNRINDLKQENLQLIDLTDDKLYANNFVEGFVLSAYQFLKYRKEADKEENKLKSISYSGTLSEQESRKILIIADAVAKVKDMVNEPVNALNAVQLAQRFQEMGKEAGFNVEVLDQKKIESLKMGGLLSVNQGSVDPATFSVMEYKPANAKNKKPIVLIGKGVVYDTGGLSLKPTANSMDTMKCDMAGAATVGGLIYAVAKAQLPVHVIALAPATDNRPGFNAFAPGDVITMYNGATVEMLNSDAEGRMILADALVYAKQYDPQLVIDLATLTGSAAAAIGQYGIVGMGTLEGDLKNKLIQSGNQVHERIVDFPFWDEYDDLLKSDIADMKNIGGPVAGAITAGKFLQRFVEDYPWYHLDIAGPAYIKGNDSYRGKNATAVGVRLLFDFLENIQA